MPYNATAYGLDESGQPVSVEAVELDAAGNVIRACGLWSHTSGTPAFEPAWRARKLAFCESVKIERDGTEGYRRRLLGLDLPPLFAREPTCPLCCLLPFGACDWHSYTPPAA